MEPSNSLQNLPEVWQFVGSTIVVVVTSGIAVYGWIKKNNPFEKTTGQTEDVTGVVELSDNHNLLRLIEETKSQNRKLERICGRLSDIYEEQERTNRILKDLM